MKFFKQIRRRGFALFLSLVMCLSLLPATAMAEELEQSQEEQAAVTTEADGSAAVTEDKSVPGEEGAGAEENSEKTEAEEAGAEDDPEAEDAVSESGSDGEEAMEEPQEEPEAMQKPVARASKASYKGTVTLYGTPEAAIKKGPTYGSKVKIDLGTRTGQSWNNVSYRIPQVSEYFELNDGWTIDYVSVAGNSSGNRQPGGSFLLGMSGGSMVYYFKQTAVQKTFTLRYHTNGGSGAPDTQTQKSTASSYTFTISDKKQL